VISFKLPWNEPYTGRVTRNVHHGIKADFLILARNPEWVDSSFS
jgi:hypothetical protein